MKRGRIAAVLAAAAWCPGHAGGVFVNSNQSAEYIRSFDRNSALDGADIAYYNMAGTARLPPGFTGNLSNQTILQRATVRPLGNPVLGGRTYGSVNPRLAGAQFPCGLPAPALGLVHHAADHRRHGGAPVAERPAQHGSGR